MNNRRMEKRPSCLKWFGNISAMFDFLQNKPWCSPWGILKMADSYFRALGCVSFAGNTFTGILIFSAMVFGNPHVAIASVMAGVISILTCKLLRAPDSDICSGGSVFNSILVGCVLTAVVPPFFEIQLSTNFWLFVAFAAFMTNFVDQGLQAMMAPSRLPVQSVPFNIVAALVFLIFRNQELGFKIAASEEIPSYTNDSNTTQEEVDWLLVMEGTIYATGQVYGVGTLYSSLLIWIGFLLYSPLLTTVSYAGSVIGACLAVLFDVSPLSDVYLGVWSFNSMLAAGGIAFFVVPTPLGVLLALANAVLATAVQAALMPIYIQTSIPVFSYPFNVAIMLLLAISLRKESPLKFVANRTFPEEHLCRHFQFCGCEDIDDADDEESGQPMQIFRKF